MKVVITQSMYFPWLGLMSQIMLADIVVHYDDVAFTRGFFNRVQLKMAEGSKWMTVPLQHVHRGQAIDDAVVDASKPWQRQHAAMVAQAFAGAPYAADAAEVLRLGLREAGPTLGSVGRASMLALADRLGIRGSRQFVDSRALGVGGSGSERILAIARALQATEYITGAGGRNYLDHEAFEAVGIEVRYMDYRIPEYPQLHGPFTPYTTALDAIANCGPDAARHLSPTTVHWRSLVHDA